jgi:hypothetical protein
VKCKELVDACLCEDSRENAPYVHNSYCSLKESRSESSATSDEIGKVLSNLSPWGPTSKVRRPTALGLQRYLSPRFSVRRAAALARNPLSRKWVTGINRLSFQPWWR